MLLNKFNTDMKKYILILMIILFANNVFAQSADSMYVQANALYNSGKYEEAVNIYEDILTKKDTESSDLYYNLGNAYFKQNILGAAILNYERAYRLNPSDEDINHNLAVAQTQLLDKFDEVPEFVLITIFGKIKSLFAANTWGILALMSFMVVLILVLLFLFARSLFIRRLSFWIACFVLLFSISCKLIEGNLRKYDNAIVFVPVLTAKTSPDDSGKDVFLLHEGTKVVVRDNFNDWTKIQLPNGEQGWVVSEAIEII